MLTWNFRKKRIFKIRYNIYDVFSRVVFCHHPGHLSFLPNPSALSRAQAEQQETLRRSWVVPGHSQTGENIFHIDKAESLLDGGVLHNSYVLWRFEWNARDVLFIVWESSCTHGVWTAIGPPGALMSDVRALSSEGECWDSAPREAALRGLRLSYARTGSRRARRRLYRGPLCQSPHWVRQQKTSPLPLNTNPLSKYLEEQRSGELSAGFGLILCVC